MSKLQSCLGLLLAIGLSGPQLALASTTIPATATPPTSATPASPSPAPILETPVAPLSASVIFVAPNGTDTPGAGTQAMPWRTIAAALAANPQPGTIVQLAPGTYSKETGEIFPLRLPAGIKLVGVPGDRGQSVVIKGGGTFLSPTFARQNIAMLGANDADINGISLTNSNPRGYALWLESSQNVTIANSTFSGTTHDGIFLTGAAHARILNNRFAKNRGSGISAVGLSSGEIRNNAFEDTGYGLSIGQRSSVKVTENRITNNRSGIIISNIATPTLRGNLIANNLEDGLVILRDPRGNRPSPDLGTLTELGQNIFRGNKQKDINNASGGAIAAIGNELNEKQVSGSVDLQMTKKPSTLAPAAVSPPQKKPAATKKPTTPHRI